MKKIFCLFMILCFLCPTLASCGMIPSDPANFDFSFTYELKQDTVQRGDRIEIVVTIKNDSHRTYVYKGPESDYRPSLRLFVTNADGTEYRIPMEVKPGTDDSPKSIHQVAAGAEHWETYVFNIPDDAPSGAYTLYAEYEKHDETFLNVFTLE